MAVVWDVPHIVLGECIVVYPATQHLLKSSTVGCALLTACNIAVKLLVLRPIGPLILHDESLYKRGAEAIAELSKYPSGHYPPLYSLVISPAILSGTGYLGIFLLNVLLTATLVPACYLLARAIRMPHPLLGAAVGALLPIHGVYPTQVLSENLFVPTFVMATCVAVSAKPVGRSINFLYGLLLGSLYLTKYLAAPGVFLLWLAWLAGLALDEQYPQGNTLKRIILSAASSVGGICVALAAWLAYAHSSDIGTMEALGLEVARLTAKDLITLRVVAMWGCAYLAAGVLLLGPLLPTVIGYWFVDSRARLRALGRTPLSRLMVLTCLLLGAYWLLCVRHSAGWVGNYPVPQRIVFRYFMHLTPLAYVTGMALMLRPATRQSVLRSAAVATVSVVSIWLAQSILYEGRLWEFPQWFATIPLYSSDILALREPWILYVVLTLTATSLFLKRWHGTRYGWVGAWIVFIALSSATTYSRAASVATTRPAHARALAPIVREAIQEHGKVVIVSQLRTERAGIMEQALEFWGVESEAARVVESVEAAAGSVDGTQIFLITTSVRDDTMVRKYEYSRSTGYIYLLHADEGE